MRCSPRHGLRVVPTVDQPGILPAGGFLSNPSGVVATWRIPTRYRPSDRLEWLAYVPVAAGVWDLAENAQITALLLSYPEIGKRQVAAASFFTQGKHLSVYAYTGLAVLLLAVALLRAAAARAKSARPSV